MKKHLVFIINPRSGTDRVKAMRQAIEANLSKELYTYDLQHTKYPSHGVVLAREAAAAGAFGVVAVGGDGSVNDVVTGLVGTSTALGIIPRGSGNGMARTMGLQLNDAACIRVINGAKIVATDIGYANDRPYISNAGVGFDALISKKFSKSNRRGFRTYSWLVMQHLWLYKEHEWRITIDGDALRERAFIVNVANGQQFGYNFKIAPQASYTDGLLDVVIIRKFPKLLGAGLVLRAMKGNITRSPYVQYYRCKEATVSHPELQLMQVDGDAHACSNKIVFRVAAGALGVLMP
jgi:YegS/Rv2252/BmrU family lipid kinase